MIARLVPVLLGLALLAAWQSALVHPLEHVDADGHWVHVPGSTPDGRSSSDPAAKLCDALAGLTALAGEAGFGIGPAACDQRPLLQDTSTPRAGAAPPFFAQAPPELL